MRTIVANRWLYTAVTLGVGVLAWLVYLIFATALHDTRFVSGWILLVLLSCLTLLNIRKKLPFLPLGSAAAWLRWHVYGGFFALILFCIHIQFRIPSGRLDWFLADLFGVVFLSGVVGLWLSKKVPQRLTTRSENVLFERIPILIRELSWDVKRLVLSSVEDANSKLIPDFHMSKLMWFFERPRYFFFHLSESNRPRQHLLDEIDGLYRYASAREKDILRELAHKVELKSDLDYQYARQWLLKGWLFVHIPLTYSMLLVAALHVIVGYDYRGTMP